MTDFYSVLQRAVSSLPDGSGPNRRAVYDKARKALLKQLQSFDPPLPSSDITAQRLALEDAIRKIENEIARQIRTQRALQTAIPAGGANRPRLAARSGAAGASAATATGGAQPGEAEGAGEAEAERAAEAAAKAEAARRAEAERARREQSALLESAVSEAAVAAAHDEDPAGASHPVPAPRTRQAERVAAPLPPDDGRMFEADPPEEDAFSVRRDASGGDDIVDGPAAPAPTANPREEKRRREADKRARKAEERRLRAERRVAKRAEKRAARPAARPSAETTRRSAGRLVLPIVVLALAAGAAYAALTQREALLAVLTELNEDPAARPPITVTGPAVQKDDDRLPSTAPGEETRTVTTTPWPPRESGEAQAATEAAPPADRTVGSDVSPFAPADPGTDAQDQVSSIDPDAAADGEADAAASQAPEETAAVDAAPSDTAADDDDSGEPIAEFTSTGTQQAVLYEQASREGDDGPVLAGGVKWSMVRTSIGGAEPEPVIRASAEIPDRNLAATLTIRENEDPALPASHLIEIEFDLSQDTEGGAVKSVPGLIMKESEEARGEPLRGAAARVSSGLFWIALSEEPEARERNLSLLRERDWIDIPILYESGRKAILTLRKGDDGLQSVNAAIRAWGPG